MYHTGTAFYFACDTPELMQAWISLIHRATMHSSAVAQVPPSHSSQLWDVMPAWSSLIKIFP